MAFLDNSGDIILDAVLTDTGRKRLAEGNFSISQFGLGDDEINYGTYDLSHPSGSAYYDLEIMQTPVFEATTAVNANINYGLLSLTSTDLLYLPALKFNEKLASGGISYFVSRTNNMFFVAVNSETSEKFTDDVAGFSHLVQGTTNVVPSIIFESGLDTDQVAATSMNRTTYLVSNALIDGTFSVSADSKFINGIGQIGIGSTISNDESNTIHISFNAVQYRSANNTSLEFDDYNDYSIAGIFNNITENSQGDGTEYSALAGPRGTMAAMNISLVDELTTIESGTRSRLYTDYGTTNKTGTEAGLGGGSTRKYDFIDTVVFLQGSESGATLQIPIRIIRYTAAS